MTRKDIIKVMKLSLEKAAGFAGIPVGSADSSETDNSSRNTGDEITLFLSSYLTGAETAEITPLFRMFQQEAAEAEQVFVEYYQDHPEIIEEYRDALDGNIGREKLEELTARLWLPELNIPDSRIVPKWKLSGVEKSVHPLTPDQVTIQLNALYTFPEREPAGLSGELGEEWKKVRNNWGRKIADYDHPVPIFEEEQGHELIRCLDELNRDIDFEKKQNVLPKNHRVTVTLSVSVTHDNLDRLCSLWIKSLLVRQHYKNLSILVLTESAIRAIREQLLGGEIPVYSVFGKYGRHFNALKYSQLLLETGFGIRAGFKLDTDEGIHSEDLYEATGKTWFQTLCHPYWGGSGINWKGERVELAVNEGEYVNSSDVDSRGYENSLRTPDVSPPGSYGGPNILFQKGFAHAGATSLYNTFNSIEDFISHPVVKGGGYGITNSGLRKAHPFTFSEVGRAEDQQFYFSGLARGIAGIFHPDLRIVHYKSSVAKAEDKTVATRFIGDMYRLVIFETLADLLGIKDLIDPMPGAFAGTLARCQAFFHTLLNAYHFAWEGKAEIADYLAGEGLEELRLLKGQIDSGEIENRLAEEENQWRRFTELADRLPLQKVRDVLSPFFV